MTASGGAAGLGRPADRPGTGAPARRFRPRRRASEGASALPVRERSSDPGNEGLGRRADRPGAGAPARRFRPRRRAREGASARPVRERSSDPGNEGLNRPADRPGAGAPARRFRPRRRAREGASALPVRERSSDPGNEGLGRPASLATDPARPPGGSGQGAGRGRERAHCQCVSDRATPATKAWAARRARPTGRRDGGPRSTTPQETAPPRGPASAHPQRGTASGRWPPCPRPTCP